MGYKESTEMKTRMKIKLEIIKIVRHIWRMKRMSSLKIIYIKIMKDVTIWWQPRMTEIANELIYFCFTKEADTGFNF